MPVTTDFKNLLAAKVFGNSPDVEIPATYYIGLSTTAKTALRTMRQILNSRRAPALGAQCFRLGSLTPRRAASF